ncbi:Peptidase S8, subtilisin-related protein [Niveomyces insectorum RCEF 264]|uniref:Peptidase S8, subtilisin-related protein n=1 Tax=Niveomyces insectorum RCEF 264 TaxID=1081102 RepID=A0A167RVA1_9HYPO|nr:Peptidase S8, subtilisin-related protein [Niveomyces insectorum RCEF 264]
MYGLKALLSVPLLVVTVSAAAGGPGGYFAKDAVKTPGVVPGAYIVEFHDDHNPQDFYDAIAGNASKSMDLHFKLFRGASIQFHEETSTAESTEQLTALPSVKQMWPVRQYHVPEHSLQWAGNMAEDSNGKPVVQRAATDTLSTHVMTQIDQLRAKGITGKGIRVGIVDTGVDYLHPALGGCFGPGCLVSFGFDLVGDAYNGTNQPQPNATHPPMDCNGHGTHVSGILAAQGNNPFSVVGAAPGVELGMFRVFGCQGNVNDDVLIAAFNRAYEAGADIITSSVGGSSGWSEQAWSVVVSRIVANGVPCTVSAGNDGSTGLFYASTAADGVGVVAVASVDNTKNPLLFSNATYTSTKANSTKPVLTPGTDAVPNPPLEHTSFGYTAGSPANWSGVTLPLWAPDLNASAAADGCTPFGAGSSGGRNDSLAGYIVLVRRGTCLFTIKAQHAVDRGAAYVLLYNNVPGTIQVDVSAVPGIKGVAMVTPEQGDKWIAALARGERIEVAMTDPVTAPKTLVNDDNKATGGYMSVYSSWGPTFDMDVKPQFASPGGLILSTFPRSMGSYAVLSGTSMACPLVAGVFALLMEARGTRDPRTLVNLLASTAKPNLYHNGQTSLPYLAPVAQQGAGLLQAYDAAYATTLLSDSSLAFNDSDHHAATRNFTITNRGHTSVVYTLTHAGAATAYTFLTETSVKPAIFPAEVRVVGSYATLNFSSSDGVNGQDNTSGDAVETTTITIPAGERRVVSVAATPPAGLVTERIPVYSGFVVINGSDGTALSLPYLGVAGSLRSLTVLDSSGTFLSNPRAGNATTPAAGSPGSVGFGGAGGRVGPNHVFVLPPPGQANNTALVNRTALIHINVNLVMGSALVRADLVPIRACSSAPGGSNSNNNNNNIIHGHGLQDILGYRTLGSIKSFPQPWMSRDTFNIDWDGGLADGTYAPPGLHKLVFHALHIFGNPDQPSDYDVVETDPFHIRYLSTPASKVGRRQFSDCTGQSSTPLMAYLCLVCRQSGHRSAECSSGAAGGAAGAAPGGLNNALAPDDDALCARCLDLDVVNLLLCGKIQDEVGGDWDAAHVANVQHQRSLGRYREIELVDTCSLCRLLFAIFPVEEPPLRKGDPPANADYFLKPLLTCNRLGNGFGDRADVVPEAVRRQYAVSIAIAARSPVDDSALSKLTMEEVADVDEIAFALTSAGAVAATGSRNLALPARVREPLVDFVLLADRLRRCEAEHPQCGNPWVDALGITQMIDVRTRTLVPTPTGCRYAALSYVWGTVIPEADGLARGTLPPAIEDAIVATRHLGLDYLWVDAVCIDQTLALPEKLKQLVLMDRVYACAYVTLMAFYGDSSEYGLRGVTSARPRAPQPRARVGGCELATIYPNVLAEFNYATCAHSTRAWTLQELWLSSRVVFFGRDQVHFTCGQTGFEETIDDRVDPARVMDARVDKSSEGGSWNPMVTPQTVGEAGGSHRPTWMAADRFTAAINHYTRRNMAKDIDSLNACLGMLSYLQRTYALQDYAWGLPVRDFPLSLLWCHARGVKPRRRPDFPSWSFVGWAGEALYLVDILPAAAREAAHSGPLHRQAVTVNKESQAATTSDLLVEVVGAADVSSTATANDRRLTLRCYSVRFEIRTAPFSEAYLPGTDRMMGMLLENNEHNPATLPAGVFDFAVLQRVRRPLRGAGERHLVYLLMLEPGDAPGSPPTRRTMVQWNVDRESFMQSVEYAEMFTKRTTIEIV